MHVRPIIKNNEVRLYLMYNFLHTCIILCVQYLITTQEKKRKFIVKLRNSKSSVGQYLNHIADVDNEGIGTGFTGTHVPTIVSDL